MVRVRFTLSVSHSLTRLIDIGKSHPPYVYVCAGLLKHPMYGVWQYTTQCVPLLMISNQVETTHKAVYTLGRQHRKVMVQTSRTALLSGTYIIRAGPLKCMNSHSPVVFPKWIPFSSPFCKKTEKEKPWVMYIWMISLEFIRSSYLPFFYQSERGRW